MEQKRVRPTWDQYFLQTIDALAARATCGRGRTACVIVKDNQILASGYVGSPPGLPHCDDVGHLMRNEVNDDGSIDPHCIRTLHSEQNAICQAAKRGISLDGATLYVTMTPCFTCAKLLIAVGIKRIVSKTHYPHKNSETMKMFEHAGIELIHATNENNYYEPHK